MVGGSGPEMKGPEGHAAVFYLDPKVARRSNLGVAEKTSSNEESRQR